MIRIDNKSNCCGCTACESICTHNAITMPPDALGFQYPLVDSNKCIECGLCERVCQFNSKYKRYDNYDQPLVYATRHKNHEQLMRSQSGGAFFGIAQDILHKGGIIYGAAFNECWKVTHQRATNLEELEKLRMSKYVQSDMQGVFKQVKDDLKQGYIVLFTGTACQTAGLKATIPSRLHQNLICVDIICHGVPSPKVWEDYINYLENLYKSKIVKACFRDKRFGWHGAKETFKFANGKEVTRNTSNILYFTGMSMRDSCANCKYTNLKRVGDITIGDFWGIPKELPYEKDNKGLSLVLINSDKGKHIFESIKEQYIVESSNTIDCLQPQLQYPSKMSPLHDIFVRDYSNNGFLYVAKKYGDIGFKFKIKNLYSRTRTFVGNILRLFKIK